MILTPEWPAPPQVRAAFTLRSGGVSQAPYDSLNLGTRVGDAAEAVAENRRRVRKHLSLPGEPTWLHQVHGTNVLDLPASAAADTPADGAVCIRSDAVCAVQVADCMPVLFADRAGTVVGAAHAGWRGLCAGILESTVHKMGAQTAHLLTWLGPAIGPDHFEVGDEVRAAFFAEDPGADAAFVANARGRWQCDLYALARRRLARLGITAVYGGGWSTWADARRFFSFRRDGVCGRMAALIWIEADRA